MDRGDDKLRKLLHDGKALENKFHYFCKNSCATTNITFQRAIIFQQKIKQLKIEEELYQFSRTRCTNPTQSEPPCRIKHEPQIFNKCLLHYIHSANSVRGHGCFD